MKNKTILLALTSLAILLTSMTLLSSSGIVPLPFNLMPEEEGEHDGDHQNPDYQGSVAIDEDLETGLEDLASVSRPEAEASALTYTTGGSVVSAKLENENGYLIWKVMVSFEGSTYEIVVDAGNATVLWASSD